MKALREVIQPLLPHSTANRGLSLNFAHQRRTCSYGTLHSSSGNNYCKRNSIQSITLLFPICRSHSAISVCIKRGIIVSHSSQWRQSEEDFWKFGLEFMRVLEYSIVRGCVVRTPKAKFHTLLQNTNKFPNFRLDELWCLHCKLSEHLRCEFACTEQSATQFPNSLQTKGKVDCMPKPDELWCLFKVKALI